MTDPRSDVHSMIENMTRQGVLLFLRDLEPHSTVDGVLRVKTDVVTFTVEPAYTHLLLRREHCEPIKMRVTSAEDRHKSLPVLAALLGWGLEALVRGIRRHTKQLICGAPKPGAFAPPKTMTGAATLMTVLAGMACATPLVSASGHAVHLNTVNVWISTSITEDLAMTGAVVSLDGDQLFMVDRRKGITITAETGNLEQVELFFNALGERIGHSLGGLQALCKEVSDARLKAKGIHPVNLGAKVLKQAVPTLGTVARFIASNMVERGPLAFPKNNPPANAIEVGSVTLFEDRLLVCPKGVRGVFVADEGDTDSQLSLLGRLIKGQTWYETAKLIMLEEYAGTTKSLDAV